MKINNKRKKIKMRTARLVTLLVALAVFLCAFLALNIQTEAADGDGIDSISEYTLRPSEAGALHVEGTSLYGENGKEVVLQGVSLHGLTWYPQYVNQNIFSYVSEDWDTNFIRLPMYSDIYSGGEQKESLNLVEKGVEYAVNANMYVLIDWHILEDNDPNTNLASAIEFFKEVSAKYADYNNVLYEICNEPNGDTTWEDVKEYADIIIPIIRRNDPDSVIMVGTPDYDRDISAPLSDPLDFDNVMYSFHFYAASHGQEMRDKLTDALEAGLPVFITECGISESSGDGILDYDEAKEWFSLLHKWHLSYAVWSLSNKEESSAMIKDLSSNTGKLGDSDLTGAGLWMRALFRGENVDQVPIDKSQEITFFSKMRSSDSLQWIVFAIVTVAFLVLVAVITLIVKKLRRKPNSTYDELIKRTGGYGEQSNELSAAEKKKKRMALVGRVALLITTFLTFIYLFWRVMYSVPTPYGWVAVACNIILLVVEIFGFAESLIHYYGMIHLRKHPLPEIKPEEFPDVDIFVSTYSEPVELLRKTLTGCKHIEYPDKKKVHIYLCDDNRRPEMRALAEELKVNYFDRPDNEGAKAGNLNHAMGLTSSPYIVTLDADMIPRREFLMKTIPYYVDAEKRNAMLKEDEKMPLGLIQTPQCFYNPDVFQHNLYDEKHIPNEQDFFYRTIESAKTYSNSVIYGGSNTILSRKALETIGGFYTKSITEDFATGMLIESSGFVSLGLSEPLASGMAPNDFKEHIQQRTRWGRGVISTARQLKFVASKKLSFAQKMSYWSSVVYWFSPIKNMIYLLAPLMYGLLGIPVFKCTITDILIFWLPMFIFQNITIRATSTKTMSLKWSGIQETVVMPFLFIPILQESFGITLSTFKVTNKDGGAQERKTDYKMLMPFLILIAASVAAIVIRLAGLIGNGEFGLIVILFWLFRNLYFLIMGTFLVDGRDSDGENVHVYDAEPVIINGKYSGVTNHLTEHSLSVFLDEPEALKIGSFVDINITNEKYDINVKGVVIDVKKSRRGKTPGVYTLEILDYGNEKDEYIEMIYDRVPTLPQQYVNEMGIIRDLWRNFAKRIGKVN